MWKWKGQKDFKTQSSGSQNALPGAAAAPGDLLEMQIPLPHPRSTELHFVV